VKCADPNLNYREWSPPATADREVSLPPVSTEIGFPAGPRRGCVEAFGRWCNADVWVQAPDSWLDIELAILGYSGDVAAMLDHRRLSDIDGMYVASGVSSGLLFSIRGRPCDRFAVIAYNGTEQLPKAKFRIECWGTEDSDPNDRAARQLVEPYARHNQVWRYTSGAAGIPAALPQTIMFANPSGGRGAVSSLEWTTDDPNPAAPAMLTMTREPGANVIGVWFMPQDGRLVVPWLPPLWTLRGERVDIVRTAAPGTHLVNASGFYE